MMSYQIGCAKLPIDFPLIPVAMMGYGNWKNRVADAKTPLHARCYVVGNKSSPLVFVQLEIGNILPAIRKESLTRLQSKLPTLSINEHNFMLMAQHTHSAPSGYSHYAFYNFTTPGFRKEIFEAIVEAIVKSVTKACQNLQKGKIFFKQGAFHENIPIAWNRSLKAYCTNPENPKLTKSQAHLAIDRSVTLLQFYTEKDQLLGSMNWFGVHPTSIGPKNTNISYDNKGYAASFLEEEFQNSCHIFAQAKAGDVSPHYHGYHQEKKRKETFRKGDHKHAYNNGLLQSQKIKELLKTKGSELNGNLKSIINYSDFTNINVLPMFSGNHLHAYTSDACLGASFFQGTPVDGPGISPFLKKVLVQVNKILNKKAPKLLKSQGKKNILVNASTKEMLGTSRLNVLPPFDKQIKEMNKQVKQGAIKEHTLVPTVLPVQLFIIGEIAIAGLPGEITTTAGKRLEKSLLNRLKNKGVTHVVISSYANSYMGYITTPEEYDLQLYEGGHTLFGKWTLGAFQTKFEELINKLENNTFDIKVKPPTFSEKELQKRTY